MSASHRSLIRATGLTAAILAAACGRLSGIDDKVLVVDAVAPSSSPGGIPARPDAGPGDGSGETLAFAARRVWMGSLDPATGKPAPGVWRRMGFNLDGEVTTLQQSAEGRSSCRRDPSSELSVQEDGEEGRDNAFASQLLPILPLIHPGFAGLEARLNESIEASGWPAPLVTINDLDPGDNDGQAFLGLFLAEVKGPVGMPWESMERVSYDHRSTLNGSPNARLLFSQGYTSGNVLVSGDADESIDTALLLPFEPAIDALVVHPRKLVLTMDLDASHRKVKSSVLAGLLVVEDLAAALLPSVRHHGGFCGAEGETKLRKILVRAADLRVGLEGELERDPEAPCNAISFGFALEWQPAMLQINQDYRNPPSLKDLCGTN